MARNAINNRAFNRSLKRYIKNADKKGTKAIRGVGLQALKMVMTKSPEDEGTFRGNWNVGINTKATSIDSRYTNETNKGASDPIKFAEGSGRIGSIKGGEIINISNALPYAMRLEFDGWSDQAPAGMVRLTLIELTFWLKAQNRRV